MKIAITYQHSLILGGSERVLEVLAVMYPSADFFCMVADERAIPTALKGRRVYTSFLNSIPGAKKYYPYFQFLCPLAAETLDLSEYDLVITSDGSHTMGVITRQNALHICYCHSPHRSIWDQYGTYRKSLSGPAKFIFTLSSHYVRQCNFLAAQRIDAFVANSNYVADRIHKYYRRESTVIYPPVDTDVSFSSEPGDYYLSVGRLSYLKKLDVVIEACNQLGRRLVIAGTGPDESRLRDIAGPTIQFLGRVLDSDLPALYGRCRALLFASDEDFGIVPVEAQAYGKPIIAYGYGGSKETVLPLGTHDFPTGVMFYSQTAQSLIAAIESFEANEALFDSNAIKKHAKTFDTALFSSRLRTFIDAKLAERL